MKSFFDTEDGYSYGSDNNGEGNHNPNPPNCYTEKENDNRNEMDPDSNENPMNSAENGPYVDQPGSGYHQTPNPSEPRKDGIQTIKATIIRVETLILGLETTLIQAEGVRDIRAPPMDNRLADGIK